MKTPLIIYWARRDLRLQDNPALLEAGNACLESGVPFLPLFVLEEYMLSSGVEYQFGYPQRHFLSKALPTFVAQFERFLLVRGKAASYLQKLAEQYDLTIYVNDDVYQDFYLQVEKLTKTGVRVVVLEDALSIPKETRTGTGNPYSVFTPFKKNVWAKFVAMEPQPAFSVKGVQYLGPSAFKKLPSQVKATEEAIAKLFITERKFAVGKQIINITDFHAVPDLSNWYYSEAEALARFKSYLKKGGVAGYADKRDYLELDVVGNGVTSRMSLALAWGLVSVRTLLSLLRKHFGETFDNPTSNRVSPGALTYISELIWREFYRYQFFYHPELMNTEFQTRFRGTIAWVPPDLAQERFVAWVKGETGYPVVDAAMKQLAATGWMHNRSRMIVASVLTKNLGVDWRWGQEYFRAMLIDLDEASNNGGWQWGASVGADPKPIRIFNPELQAKNYDVSGAYQKRWLGTDGAVSRQPIVPHIQARTEARQRYGLDKKARKNKTP